MSPTAPRRPRQQKTLTEQLRAEGAKPYVPTQEETQDRGAAPAVGGAEREAAGEEQARSARAAAGQAPADAPSRTKQEALVTALYDLALDEKTARGDKVDAMRLIMAYCEGRPAQVQVKVARNRPSKTYVVVSPDDWPER